MPEFFQGSWLCRPVREVIEIGAIALGTLDTTFEPSKQRHIHVGSRATWLAFHDAWPKHE